MHMIRQDMKLKLMFVHKQASGSEKLMLFVSLYVAIALQRTHIWKKLAQG